MARIGRRESFSAAHRLHSPHLSEAENQQVYGKCNNPNGHGHNYRVEVWVEGPIDERTGMVMNLVDLNDLLKCTVIDILDHKHLDKDVEWFSTRPR